MIVKLWFYYLELLWRGLQFHLELVQSEISTANSLLEKQHFGVSSKPILLRYSGGWSPIGSIQHCGHQWPIVPAPGDYDDGEVSGMIGRGNWNTRRKLAPMPLCPPQTPHADRTRTLTAAVGHQQLTAWATARPPKPIYFLSGIYCKSQWMHYVISVEVRILSLSIFTSRIRY
jgi:hypothetical protein